MVEKGNGGHMKNDNRIHRSDEHKPLSSRLSIISSIIDNIEALAIATDTHGRIVFANPAATQLCGYSQKELSNLGIEDIFKISHEQRHQIDRCRQKVCSVKFETVTVKKDGSSFPVQVSISPLRSAEIGQGMVICAVNISSLKQALDQQARLVTALEHAAEAIIITEPDGKIQYVNPAFEQITGYSRTEVTAQHISLLESGKHDEVFLKKIWDTLHRGDVWRGRFINRKKSGILYESEATISPVKNESGDIAYFVNVQRDVTHEVQLGKQLRQAQKMEAIGTLAGGIAHHFNNLLMGIQGNISLSLLEIDSESPLFDKLKKIEEYVQNGVELTGKLLGFARGGKYEVRLTDVNELLREQTLVFARAHKEVVFQAEYFPDLWHIEADRGQIEQIILNLYINAMHAMPGGGTLIVRTENINIDKEHDTPYRIKAGKYIKITVADSGIGMDAETQRRIFDPFFTTKEMGRGRGLGLASAYGIIKNHEGFIKVTSQKGQGTQFDVYLPAAEIKASKIEKTNEEFSRGKETVLLVDDEEMIVDVGARMLNKLGYDVLTAVSGDDAIKIYKKHQVKIDLVILDMVMPKLSGGETFDRLKGINPHIKVILSSGYSIDGQATEILQRGCKAFIQKPFNLQTLSQNIKAVLENKT
jgi:PAS domain S-box-containing protein